MIRCEFELNNQPMSRFKCGKRQVDAFSGNGIHTNRIQSMYIPSTVHVPGTELSAYGLVVVK